MNVRIQYPRIMLSRTYTYTNIHMLILKTNVYVCVHVCLVFDGLRTPHTAIVAADLLQSETHHPIAVGLKNQNATGARSISASINIQTLCRLYASRLHGMQLRNSYRN